MLLKSSFKISNNETYLSGHFLNNPVVPAVVLLEKVEDFIKSELISWKILELIRVKFIEKILPEDELQINLNIEQIKNKRLISFSIVNKQNCNLLVIGKFKLETT